ncbi:restriction endonuclease subunit S [Streptomyces goshikiensis]|uniref:restriction endonuclease subunit S n=1 Tax=Streptomyces goshikiensis TaxID=1942 RepID=UPI00371651E6
MSTPLSRIVEVNPSVPEFLDNPDAEVTFMPLETVWPDGRADTSRRAVASVVAAGYTQFRDGDVLLPKITPTFEAGRVLAVSLETPVGAGTTELHVLRPKVGVDARFVAYLCRSQEFLQEGAARLQGVGNLRRVPKDFIEKFPVTITNFDEQKAIADYLDRETAQIDTLITEQRRLVGMLRERRFAVRTWLATSGVGAAAETRASGLFWAGDVPAHWKVVPLTSVASLESGHTPSRSRTELWENCYIPWISLNDVGYLSAHEYISETTNLISDAGIAASSARLLPAGTVVLSRDATVGRSGIMAVPMATSQHFADWVCTPDLEPRYLWLLFTSAMQPYFDSFTNGSTLRTIGMGHLKAFRVPLPPVEEQREIVEAAARQTSRIDTLIAESERLIELSLERRSALITSAVTGQIDLRGEAA